MSSPMKLLGVVGWTDTDKRGSPIAGVRPLVEIQKAEWRVVDPRDEFPSQGQVFWPNAQQATEGALLTFRADPNPGQKDEFKVAEPKPAMEVLDLRRFGDPTQVRAALVGGVRLPGPVGQQRVLIRCKEDVLVGPVEVTRVATGTVRLTGANLAKVPNYSDFSVRPVTVSAQEQRFVRVDDRPPTGYVDWDDDAALVKRALEIAVRVTKQTGGDTGQTKRQIEEAANALAAQLGGVDAQLERYRVDRALELCRSSGAIVAAVAPQLAELLRGHPAVQRQLEEVTSKVRAEAVEHAREDVEQQLARERSALQELTAAVAAKKAELTASEAELTRLKEAGAAKALEEAVDERVLAAFDRPLELLAQVSVLRPFLSGRSLASIADPPPAAPTSSIDWSGTRGEAIKDRAALRRVLLDAARARGVEPSVMSSVHAAVAAGLMPVSFGPSALAMIVAYGHAVCGGRVSILHVSPAVLHPRDLEDAAGGLIAASNATRDIDGISLMVFEGANRAPIEASILPLLQLRDVMPTSSVASLRFATTLVAGATTVPVTPQLWSHAVAIYPEPTSAAPQSGASGDVSVSSELFALGDVPSAQVDELLDAWPECTELKPALQRFGAALGRFYEGDRISNGLLHGLVLPYVATCLTPEEQEQAVARAHDPDDVGHALRRLRQRLC